MCKFFIDTEFHEYSKQPKVCGIKIGKPIDTIELISIGIVSEEMDYVGKHLNNDGIVKNPMVDATIDYQREYYAICKEFDLKAAWNNEWLRENVLKPIYDEYDIKYQIEQKKRIGHFNELYWNYKSLKKIINRYGKTKKQIAEEILEFTKVKEKEYPVKCQCGERDICYECQSISEYNNNLDENIEFYAYYADYDWVVFCWLFGRMIDLPKGFPMYCKDLKQMLDEKLSNLNLLKGDARNIVELRNLKTLPERLGWVKNFASNPNYPKQFNEHNALADAKWNKELWNFINKL